MNKRTIVNIAVCVVLAIAIAVSAAAIAMAKIENIIPSICPGNKKRLNTAKLMSTALSISSIEMSIMSMFLRVINPYTPAKNMTKLSTM